MNTNDGGSGSKMTWDDWSDLEVNAHVTILCYSLQGWEYSENMQQFYHCGITGDETHNQPIIDFCNSWSDMGPVIVENKIGLQPDPFKDGVWFSYDADDLNIAESTKPLRAAAIVFLEMNGVKP